jgi:hypothetical protein
MFQIARAIGLQTQACVFGALSQQGNALERRGALQSRVQLFDALARAVDQRLRHAQQLARALQPFAECGSRFSGCRACSAPQSVQALAVAVETMSQRSLQAPEVSSRSQCGAVRAMSSAAAEGVGALSATKSAMVKSTSWPMAETTGIACLHAPRKACR